MVSFLVLSNKYWPLLKCNVLCSGYIELEQPRAELLNLGSKSRIESRIKVLTLTIQWEYIVLTAVTLTIAVTLTPTLFSCPDP